MGHSSALNSDCTKKEIYHQGMAAGQRQLIWLKSLKSKSFMNFGASFSGLGLFSEIHL